MNLNFYLKWSATSVTLFGALLTSIQYIPWNIYALNIGALLFLIWSIRIKERSLIAVNFGLLFIYIIGLFI